jgi:hypothetical protein
LQCHRFGETCDLAKNLIGDIENSSDQGRRMLWFLGGPAASRTLDIPTHDDFSLRYKTIRYPMAVSGFAVSRREIEHINRPSSTVKA